MSPLSILPNIVAKQFFVEYMLNKLKFEFSRKCKLKQSKKRYTMIQLNTNQRYTQTFENAAKARLFQSFDISQFNY